MGKKVEKTIIKDERLQLRVNQEAKKQLMILSIEMGFKNMGDFVMYCCNKELMERKNIKIG